MVTRAEDDIYWKEQEQKLIDKLKDRTLTNKDLINVYCVGDCFTFGTGATKGKEFPTILQYLLGEKYKVYNLGRTMLSMYTITEWNELLNKLYEDEGSIVVLWAGTNDLFLKNDLNESLSFYLGYLEKLELKKINTIGITVLPREKLSDQTRNEFNEKVSQKGNILKIHLDDRIGYKQTPKFYTMDGTHLNDNGHVIMAFLVFQMIIDMV